MEAESIQVPPPVLTTEATPLLITRAKLPVAAAAAEIEVVAVAGEGPAAADDHVAADAAVALRA